MFRKLPLLFSLSSITRCGTISKSIPRLTQLAMPGRLQQRRASADADPYTAIHTSGCMIYTAPAPHSSKEASRPRP
jgi:hypothetical protein